MQCVRVTDRLSRVGVRREEFLLLKAIVIANFDAVSSSSSSSTSCSPSSDASGAADSSSSSSTISTNKPLWKLRESLLSALYDCVAVIR